jgi:hypothetical protein
MAAAVAVPPAAAEEVARLLVGRDAASILVVTGAGIEPDLSDLNPNAAHALCALIVEGGGGHVTTNFSGVQLLAAPEHGDMSSDTKSKKFVAVHGTLYDQEAGRRGKGGRRRPRCLEDAESQPLLPTSTRNRRVPIPTKDVDNKDPNVLDAQEVAKKGRKTLLVMGSSLIKATNGRALHFLDKAPDISRVIFVNPDRSRVVADVASDLDGWGLPQLGPGIATPASVECVQMKAEEFAEAVLQCPDMADLRDTCYRWIAPDKVARARKLFPLPPVEDLTDVGAHKFGAARVTVRQVYDEVAKLNALAMSSLGASAAATAGAPAGGFTSERLEGGAAKKHRVARD